MTALSGLGFVSVPLVASGLVPLVGFGLVPLGTTGLVPLVGTYLSLAVFLSVTAFIAARFVLAAEDVRRAVTVGFMAAVIVLLSAAQLHPLLVIGSFAVVDFAVIKVVYRLRARTAAGVALIHYTVSVIVGFTVISAIGVLSTAPV